jgi:hypothetical protein
MNVSPADVVHLRRTPPLLTSNEIGYCTLVIAVPAHVTAISTTQVVELVHDTICLVNPLLINVVPRTGLVAEYPARIASAALENVTVVDAVAVTVPAKDVTIAGPLATDGLSQPSAGVVLPILDEALRDVTVGSEENVGSLPVLPISTCPVVPAAVALIAFAALPTSTPLAARVVLPVPPCGTVTGIAVMPISIGPQAEPSHMNVCASPGVMVKVTELATMGIELVEVSLLTTVNIFPAVVIVGLPIVCEFPVVVVVITVPEYELTIVVVQAALRDGSIAVVIFMGSVANCRHVAEPEVTSTNK